MASIVCVRRIALGHACTSRLAAHLKKARVQPYCGRSGLRACSSHQQAIQRIQQHTDSLKAEQKELTEEQFGAADRLDEPTQALVGLM